MNLGVGLNTDVNIVKCSHHVPIISSIINVISVGNSDLQKTVIHQL